ncbi:unnamed protein product [Lactuca virosa]|uniref:Uncharacterized protein n=1 Tax=Lactuca virosa TaxID=75947 RepID=A0AAU9MXS6_9ASTR|nr:unnamed protein product [Lactuca virosa]
MKYLSQLLCGGEEYAKMHEMASGLKANIKRQLLDRNVSNFSMKPVNSKMNLLVIMNLVNVSNGKSLHVPYHDSKFYSGECYIFQYTYPGEDQEEYLIGTWFGKQSVEEDQHSAGSQENKMIESLKFMAAQLQIYEGREPVLLFAIFQSFLVFKGGLSGGYKNSILEKELSDETYKEDGVALFRVQGYGPENMQAIQVEPENLFYTVPPDAIEAYRKSIESHLLRFEALVVLVHDMGPNWELISDVINSTLQFKLFIDWLLDLSTLDPVFEGANFQVLTALATSFHALQPLKVPAFRLFS